MFKVKNIILSLALLGCSGLAQAQQVEQRIDSLQILIGQQTVLHLKASVKQGDKVQLPSFKPQQQITPGVEVVEQSKGDTSHIGDDRMVVSRDYTLTSFDEKVYVIPALNVKVNGKNCHGNQLALKVLTVPVGSERKVLGVFYDEPERSAFPVSAIEFKYRPCDKLTHRDFLGTLMSLGIERDTVGDILVDNGRTVVFVKSELKDYIESQIFKVGGAGVKIVQPNLNSLPQGRGTEEMSLTVSSLRYDNIVAAVSGLSRDKTAKLILSGETTLNFAVTQNVSCTVKEGDTFTIRGKGKFKLDKILGVTKKGRHKISVIHFR